MNEQEDAATFDLKGVDAGQLFRAARQKGPTPLSEIEITAGVLAEALKDKYDQVRPMEGGGMSCVFEAYHKILTQWMVIKLPAPKYRTAEDVERFVVEARAIYGLRDKPNIVRFTEVGQVLGVPYFAMEKVEGKPLSKVMASLSDDQKLGIGIAVCEALAAVHRVKITHRDIKPANIIITSEHQVKVIDFGIASVPEESSGQTVAGSPGYKAPEQGCRLPVDHRADIYSLGVTLCEMFTEKMSLEPESSTKLARGLVDAILKATRQLPEERFQTMDDLAAVLKGVRSTSRPPPLPQTPTKRPPVNTSAKTEGPGSSVPPPPPPVPPPLKPETAAPRTAFSLPYRYLAMAAGVFIAVKSLGWENCLFGLLIGGATQLRLVAWRERLVIMGVLGLAWGWRLSLPVTPENATASRPFVNSLGMEFVPVPGRRILIAVRPTERAAFGVFTADPLQAGKRGWAKAVTTLKGEHRPVTRANFQDGQEFCDWLSEREHRHYRLPLADEWTAAVAPSGHMNVDEVLTRNKSEVDAIYDGVHLSTVQVKNSTGIDELNDNRSEWCGDAPSEIKGVLFRHLRRADFMKGDRAIIWSDLALPTTRRYSEIYEKAPASETTEDGLMFRCVLELDSTRASEKPAAQK
ncbi:protein kinase domain-containing protein [Prosthecobacter sp.]|uniref:protein kinase domain-containing protein n=1 Tax=Prosthecobacter sp. TaxID=1965333 RepID=UPI0037851F0D